MGKVLGDVKVEKLEEKRAVVRVAWTGLMLAETMD